MNFPMPRYPPKKICKAPAIKAHAERYAGPCIVHKDATTTAHAPLALLQIPALPPNEAATNPRNTVVHNPTSGETPATYANDTASGIMASETANPAARLDITVSRSILDPNGFKSFAFLKIDSICEGGGDLSSEDDDDDDPPVIDSGEPLALIAVTDAAAACLCNF